MPVKDEDGKIKKQESTQQSGVESIKEEDKEENKAVFIQHEPFFKGGEFLERESFGREERFLDDEEDNEFGL